MTAFDVDALKQRTKRIWALGDYSQVARLTGQAARPLVDACAVSAGQEVLDVAAGTGNAALVAASEGARVVACDITPAMLDLGRERSRAEGLDVEWVEGDAEQLPFADESFDCVLSAFGLILAPRPEIAAAEAFRVLRPGGTFGITSWTPDSPIPLQTELVARFLPPQVDVPAAAEWGNPDVARARLAGLAASVDTIDGTAEWSGESADDYVAMFDQKSGPGIAARQALPPERYAELRSELVALARSRAEGDGPVSIKFEYLVVVARKRG